MSDAAAVEVDAVASEATRRRLRASSKVQQGVQDYLERYAQHNGKVPSISAGEFLERLDQA